MQSGGYGMSMQPQQQGMMYNQNMSGGMPGGMGMSGGMGYNNMRPQQTMNPMMTNNPFK